VTKAKHQRAAPSAHPHEKPHHPHWPLAALLFLFVLALGLMSVHETATWIHIRTGARILSERVLPRTDPFSYTVAGRSWTTDSWLADVIFSVVNAHFGPRGLIVLKSIVAAAGFALLLPLNFASPLTSAAVLGLGAVSAWSGLTEMPSVFDLLLLSLLVRLLRPRKKFRFATLAQVAGLEWFWANLHGTTAVLGLWIVLLKAFKASLRSSERDDRLGHWSLVAAALFALSLNPHGLAVAAHTFRGMEASTTAWQPLSPYFNLYNLFCLAGAAGCVVLLQQEFFLTLTAATALALSLVVPEMRALAILACCPVVALALGHFTPPQDDDLLGLARWAIVMSALLGIHWLSVTVPLGSSRGYGVQTLEGAAQFLKSSGVRGRMFNEVESGALLIGAGDRPVFVDARAALYGPQFVRDAQSWPARFSQLDAIYGFDYAVILNQRARYPARILDEEAGWRLAYADDASLVYIKRSGASGWLVKDWPAPVLRPNALWPDVMDPMLADARRLPKVMEELDRWILQAPDSAQALIWKGYALDRRNLSDKAERLLRLAALRGRVRRDPELSAALAFALDRRGESVAARRLFGQAALIARRRGERHLYSQILAQLAVSYRREGRTSEADSYDRRAREADVPAFAEDI
jgi:tetratricopeptide (TPR) repeat protein